MLTHGNEMFGSLSTIITDKETRPRITSEQMNISIARGRVIARRVRPIARLLRFRGYGFAGGVPDGFAASPPGLRAPPSGLPAAPPSGLPGAPVPPIRTGSL